MTDRRIRARFYGLSAKFGIKRFRVLAGMLPFSRCRVPLSVMDVEMDDEAASAFGAINAAV